MQTLEAIAQRTGGQAFRITPSDTSLSRLAAAIEGLEQKTLAQEWSYRRKERFQAPLAIGLAGLTAGLLLPLPRLPRLRWRRSARSAEAMARAAVVAALLLAGADARAQATAPAPVGGPMASAAPAGADAAPRKSGVVDEVLLRPRRATTEGRGEYDKGNHPQALKAFEKAAAARPGDPGVLFNLADGLYKNARYDEAAAIFGALGEKSKELAAASRFNLGNTAYQKQDYRGAVKAYRDALRAAPDDVDARRNLEMALRALKEQEEQQKKQQQQKDQEDKKQDDKGQPQDQKNQQGQQKKDQQQQQGQDQQKQDQQQNQPKPQTPQERADQRFRDETGMPKERAMQLLDALQQNEKAEQKKQLAVKRAQKKKGTDW
jgi:TolA-binding protein